MKYHGYIGYAVLTETATDVFTEEIVEREAQGDILKVHRRLVGSEHINDNIVVSNQISIVADPFAYHNFHSIRYASWMGANWKVTSVEPAYPRLILDLGGVYNGKTGAKRETP